MPMSSKTKTIALGGILAAVAIVVMCLGGLIPVATYVCPLICIFGQHIVFSLCGRRIAWTWYVVVSILSMLLGPDKEAAAVFMLLGYYPMVKPVFEKWPLSWLWKLLLFNGAVAVLYTVILRLLGINVVSDEFVSVGLFGLILLLILANITFYMMDKMLTLFQRKWKKR